MGMSDLNLEKSDRAEAIATTWYQALVDMDDIPQPPELIRHELIELTRQIISLSSEDQFQTEAARAIGARLALLGYTRVDMLGKTPAILSHQLAQDLDPNQIKSLHTRLGNVLTQVITGFLEQHHQASLVEMEHALQAYETVWKRFIIGEQEIEQNSQVILRALPDTLGIITREGVVLYYHGGAERKFPDDDKLLFKNIRNNIPDEVANELLTIYRSVIDTGQAQSHEYSVTFEKLEKRFYQDKITPYLGNSVLVISRDITKQKKIEDDLRASEARYRSVVETQSEFIGRFTPDGIITFVNEAAYRLFGGSAQDIIGQHILKFLSKSDREKADEAVASTYNLTPQNPSITRELRVDGVNGDFMQIEVVTQAIFNDQGETIEYQTSGRDITDLRRMEAALRESEAHYRSVVEGQTELIIRYLPDTTITFANEALCRFFSQSRQELMGGSALDFVYGDDKLRMAESLANLHNLTSDNPIHTGQTRVVLASGEIRWIEWTTRVIFRTDGLLAECQSVGRDITALKQAQETLERQNELLRQLSDQMINIQEIERQRIARDLHDAVLNELGVMLIAAPEILTPQAMRDNYEHIIEQFRQTINGLRQCFTTRSGAQHTYLWSGR